MEPAGSADMKSAHQYLIDPLMGPEPSEETGPGSHFRSTFDSLPKGRSGRNSYPSPPNSAGKEAFPQFHPQTTGSSSKTNPFRKSSLSSKDGSYVTAQPISSGYATPPSSASPRRSTNPFRDNSYPSPPHSRRSSDHHHRSPGHRHVTEGRPRRSSSLRERYPGDRSVYPLDELRREEKLARRSPHLNKRHLPGPDTIDRLDQIGGKYHHEGPYDATLLARNTDIKTSPIAAVAESNAEALRATPRENIMDALEKHYPIEGTAAVPPGTRDRFGRVYNYREGEDMMIADGGNYKRWDDVEYRPNDIKGKGEPLFDAEEYEAAGRKKRDDDYGIEMTTRPRNKSDAAPYNAEWQREEGVHRSNTTGRKVTEGIKKRISHIRKKTKE
ncbi:uncharacterized protein K452DRAFT_315009 [Aplosporella prunicola CBS 121167]|uniref:Pal1 cell morphology protein n=1 Tax=Aplosporella prunicola CBS 121167 TaxID=1176127 RepID=A0A6A6BS11_9PEZI|nr:uncharacterized protein K452DRAFT_315009 [Aplosporella prunicola CBS 121167]KAF2146790.1 hypothetical protein K452DRAFT_315009 [Aplosporella prunicola CBS 121167]